MYRTSIIFLACVYHLACTAQDPADPAPELPVCTEHAVTVEQEEPVPGVIWADGRFIVFELAWDDSPDAHGYAPPLANTITAISTDAERLWTQRVDGLLRIWSAGDAAWALTSTGAALQINRIEADGALIGVTDIDLAIDPAGLTTSYRQTRAYVRPDGRAGWLLNDETLWRFDEAGVRAVEVPNGWRVGYTGVLSDDETLVTVLVDQAEMSEATYILGAVTPDGRWTTQPIDGNAVSDTPIVLAPTALAVRPGQIALGLTRYGPARLDPVSLGMTRAPIGAVLMTYDRATLNAVSMTELEIEGRLRKLFAEGDGWLAMAGDADIHLTTVDANGGRLSHSALGSHFVDFPINGARAPDGSLLISAMWLDEESMYGTYTPYLLSIPSGGCMTPERLQQPR